MPTTVTTPGANTDGTSAWAASVATAMAGCQTAPVMRVYTTVGANTWTKPANCTGIWVRVQAGGGGSGGTALTGASQCAGGGGGGGGGYAEEMISAAVLGATETVTVGAGGTAGTTAGAGGTGGTSSFGTTPYLSATGGAGGALGGVLAVPNVNQGGAAGGSGSGGTMNITGGNSLSGVFATAARAIRSVGGTATMSTADGTGVSASTTAASAGGLYGGGATGGVNCQSQGTAIVGAAGGQGIVVVFEFY